MKNIFTTLFVVLSYAALSQNVAINATGAAPAASAMLDVSSTNSGVLIPRMTTAQRVAIAAPATSLRVYDTNTNTHWYFNGTVWVEMLDGNIGWRITGNTLTSAGIFGSNSAHDVRFFSNGTERMRLLSAGEMVINSTTPFTGDLFSVYSTGTQFPISAYVTGTGSVSAGTFSNASSSTTGIGVLGTISGGSGAAGVRGTGNTGNGNAVTGVGQSATAFGFRGHNTNASGTGALITANGVAGSYLINGTGAAITGSTGGVWCRTTNAANGIGGYFSGNALGATGPATGGAGLASIGDITGVAGYANSTANLTLKSGGYFDASAGVSFAYVGARTALNVNRKIEGNGTVNTTVKDVNNNLVVMSCPEAPENFFQDFGVGQLVNGKAVITLDPNFSKNIVVNTQHPLRVFVQLKGDCKGVYVSDETQTGFTVTELQGGNSNVKFTYFITANRADEVLSDGTISPYSVERFAPAIGPMKTTKLQDRQVNDGEILNQGIIKTK